MKKFGSVLALCAVVAGLAFAEGQNGTTLLANKTANGRWKRTYGWTIQKSVQPSSWYLYQGDTGTSQYTVSVVRDNGTDTASVYGEVCVTNAGEVATEGLQINDSVYLPPSKTPIATASVNVGVHPVLAPGETFCYPYEIAVPVPPSAGATYKDTADITITNHSGHLNENFGPSPSASNAFPASPELVNGTVNVDDTNGMSWSFSDSGSQTYSKTFACYADNGEVENTAKIRETGQEAEADVYIRCGRVTVEKDASTSLKRTYGWTIAKTVDQPTLTLAVGQQYTVNYNVTVNGSQTDSDWAVRGNVRLTSGDLAANLLSLADTVSTGINAPLDCSGATFPLIQGANSTLSCLYQTALPDGSNRTNTATTVLQNYSYDSNGFGTPTGTSSFSGSANVNFSNASLTEVDRCSSVVDTLGGSFGSLCCGQDTLPKTYTYTWQVGPYAQCGNYTVNNTASVTAADSNTTGASSQVVTVNVPCNQGCTLTIGYWKTHAGFGPQRDMVTERLPLWLGTNGGAKSVQVTNAQQAVSILKFELGAPSNGITKLYAQLLAAKLSIAAGASNSAVSTVIAQADAFLANNNQDNWQGLNKAGKESVLAWMTALDSYNNGLTGPGHCSE